MARAARSTLLRALPALLVATLGLAACDAGADSAEPTATAEATANGTTEAAASADGNAVTIGLVLEPVSLDFTSDDGAAIPEALLLNVYETLVELGPEGDLQPLLAQDWTVSDDGLVYDFQLREGVTFSNGDPFDAEAVKFSIEAVQTDWDISLAAAMDVVESVEVVSPTEVRVTLSQRSNDFLFRLTTRIGAMFSPTGVDDLANEAIGTGPYVLEDWARGDRITFTARDDYWGEAPAYETVTLRYFEDGSALNNALLGDDINVIGTVQAPESIGQFEGGDYEIVEGTTNGEVVLSFNNANPPLDDVDVRRAIRYAIDNQAVMDTAWGGYGELIGSMVPPTDPWYEDRTGDFPRDLDQARDLLDGADLPDEPLAFRVPNTPYATAAAQTVQSNLGEVGIETEIEVIEFPVWLEEVFGAKDYHMSVVAHVEPRDMGAVFGNPDYYIQFDNAEVQQLLADADAADPDERNELMADAAEVISLEAASEFLFLAPNLQVTDGTVTGVPANDLTEAYDFSSLAPAG